jgi:crotonobetainyl-CoA:carnitine CoA-transferase CaiB-like acyl-CoA transferase
LGAEVIKIETKLRPDVTRLATVKERVTQTDQSADFAALNCSKKSITLNMKQPQAIELIKKLVKVSDVVTENFGGAVMDRWGLGYQELKKIKSDIIFYVSTGYGRTGPYKETPAYAPVVDAFSGVLSVNGYADGMPCVIGTRGWTDAMVAVHGVFVMLAALHHRSETGEGQYIEITMTEESINSLGDLVLDYSMNGRVGQLAGNRDSIMAPHGCYRCQGEDRWVAIAISGDIEWNSFCNAIGNPEWTHREEFSDQISRWNNQRDLDELVQEWTIQHTDYAVMKILQSAGVAAGVCLDVAELEVEPNLIERGFFVDIEESTIGKRRVPSLPWNPSDTDVGNYSHAPLIGEHNDYVFGELLSMPEEEIRQLEKNNVIC